MPALQLKYEKEKADYPAQLEQWQETVNKPWEAAVKAWEQDCENAKKIQKPLPAKPTMVSKKPELGAAPDKFQLTPTTLFNAMIRPLIPYAIEGVIWYQGENNGGKGQEYSVLFPALIGDWRAQWGQGDFPFFFCQLANFKARATEPGNSGWAEIREAQRLTLSVSNTGMAVLIDLGEEDDIHPLNKKDVGDRLAKIALAKTFCLVEGDSTLVQFIGP